MAITNDFRKAFRVTLKIREGASPHVYTVQLKRLMVDDTSLHPMMERTLKLLKKTRTPYIQLSALRELVFDSINYRHFDRSADPVGNWVCTLWSEEEVKDFESNPEEYITTVLRFFEVLGYDLYSSAVCSIDYVKSLEDLTIKQIESQRKQRDKIETEKMFDEDEENGN